MFGLYLFVDRVFSKYISKQAVYINATNAKLIKTANIDGDKLQKYRVNV